MDIAVVGGVFALIFVAELPDKTAIAALVLGSKFSPAWVFAGMATAFAVHVAVAVTAGQLLTLLPQKVLESVVGAMFLIGAWLLWRSGKGEEEEAHDTKEPKGPLGAAVLGFGVILVAEFGDLTQLMTANLAAKYDDPVSVATGAVLGLWAVSLLALLGGKTLLKVLPISLIARIGAVVMAGFAAYNLVRVAA